MQRKFNKRNFLALSLAGTSVALGCAANKLAAQTTEDNVMTRAEYQLYLDLFNVNDPAFIEFYHPDVAFELGNRQMQGARTILEFYANVKKYIKEEVTCTEFVANSQTVAVEIPTRFECIADWEDSFWGIPLRQGQILEIVTFGFYKMRAGKFASIKTARYKVVKDWS
jgi:hypothetical protein